MRRRPSRSRSGSISRRCWDELPDCLTRPFFSNCGDGSNAFGHLFKLFVQDNKCSCKRADFGCVQIINWVTGKPFFLVGVRRADRKCSNSRTFWVRVVWRPHRRHAPMGNIVPAFGPSLICVNQRFYFHFQIRDFLIVTFAERKRTCGPPQLNRAIPNTECPREVSDVFFVGRKCCEEDERSHFCSLPI
mgnify:CR=1 FL=1